MNLKKLNVFYLTAKYTSCGKAADELSVTQPAVSMQIRELEEFYQVNLFSRAGNRMQLTDAGRMLYSYAENIFKLADEAENRLLDLEGLKKEVLRIGTISTYGKYVLPPFISAFQKENPRVRVVVKEGSSFQMTQSVAEKESELAIVADTGHWKRLSSVPFRKEELFLVVSNEHAWFNRKDPVDIEELKKEHIILREEGSAARYTILRLFKRHHFEPNIFLEGGGSDFIKETVKGGKGLSFFILSSVKEETENGLLRPLRFSSEKVFLDVRIFFRGKKSLTAPAKEFFKIRQWQPERQSEFIC